MSIGGPSPLGTLLVQRLDAVLGVTLSQQANLVTGARPDAVAQAASAERVEGARHETLRHPQDAVDRTTAQTEQNARNTVDKARLEARSAALLLARDAPNTTSTPSAPTTLGHAAKTILALLAGYPELSASVQGRQPLLSPNTLPEASARANTTATARGGATATPVTATATTTTATSATLQNSTPSPTQLAAALSQAVQGSGMFYEAHLAGLAFGKLSVAQLMQEPQAQIGRPAGTPSPNPAAPAASAGTPTAAHAGDAANTAPATARSAESSSTAPLPAASPAGNAAQAQPAHIPGLDPQAHTLVRQQLEVLANQSFNWHGEAWPGAEMDWEISRREPQDESGADAAGHWATRLTLNLPGLGQVQARLNLAGKQLVMHLVSPQSAELLAAHAEALRSRYAAQGLQLSQLSIAPQESQQDAAPTSDGAAS